MTFDPFFSFLHTPAKKREFCASVVEKPSSDTFLSFQNRKNIRFWKENLQKVFTKTEKCDKMMSNTEM